MAGICFHLTATVSTENPTAILPVLMDFLKDRYSIKELAGKDMAYEGKGEFSIQAELEGENSKELNRSLLTALRKAEKRTSLRAAWSFGVTLEQYFDYVLKKRTSQ